MAFESYNTLCHEIYKQIIGRLERNNEKDYHFAPCGTAQEVLQHDILRHFFRSLDLQSELTEEDLITRVDERQLHDFLAILIFTACSIEAARTFTTELVAKDPWLQDICSLPAEREKLIELFGEEVTPHRFVGQQACFCPVVIRKREEVQVQNPKGRLPYLEQQRLAEGSFGKVYKVKISKGHFYDPQTGVSNREPIELARKDYTISPEFTREADHEIMKKILSSNRTSNNIVESYGTLVTESTTYSLFMPLAICDLRAYMMEYHPTKPNTTAEKVAIILSAQGLASGLNFLHNGMKAADGEELVCYHMDLKPSNILIFRETTGDKEHFVWKISDFGMSRVKIRHRKHGGEKERDFNRWFLRSPPPAPSPSPTLALHGEGTYLAPESISAIPSMKTESDVWSLGCVISVIFAYLEEGSHGVERYQEARIEYHKADGYDRFFLRDRGFVPPKVHPLVHKWHTHLIDKASQRNLYEGDALKFMLRHLEYAVFQVDQSKRCGVREVEKRLRSTYDMYSSLGGTERDDNEEGRQRRSSIITRIRSRGHGTEPGADRPVDEWFLDAHDPFKGCEISPGGDLVAFWTDIKILLYTSQSLGERNMATAAGEYSLEATADCIWKNIALTEKYLIASTTGANFQCWIFDLKQGAAVDASLNHRQRVTLTHPEISKVAISPGSKTMACILRDEENDQKPGSLFLAPVTSVSQCRWFGRFDCPARDVMQLSFSTEDDIYILVRPQLTVRSREHKIPIIHVCRRTKKLHTLIIESKGLDSSSTAGLFTTFAPFRQKAAACAVVTREKRLHIQSLMADAFMPAVQLDIKNYRVLKLIMGRRDEKLYAVGRPLASHRMLLLEITMPRPASTEVSVRELAPLPGLSYDVEFTERLSDEREENYVLIASLAGANQRAAIRRVRLPN